MTYEPGQRVWLSTEHVALLGPRKMQPKFIGPYLVKEKVGELAYRLDLPPSLKLHNVFHVD